MPWPAKIAANLAIGDVALGVQRGHPSRGIGRLLGISLNMRISEPSSLTVWPINWRAGPLLRKFICKTLIIAQYSRILLCIGFHAGCPMGPGSNRRIWLYIMATGEVGKRMAWKTATISELPIHSRKLRPAPPHHQQQLPHASAASAALPHGRTKGQTPITPIREFDGWIRADTRPTRSRFAEHSRFADE